VIVIGGSGDYFDVADTVIAMENYVPRDATSEAKLIASKYRAERKPEGGDSFGRISNRIPVAESMDPSRGRRDVKVTAKGVKTLLFGRNEIDLTSIEQLVDPSQIRSIGDAMVYAKSSYMDGRRTLREIIDLVVEDISEKGLDILSPFPEGNYALPRKFEITAAINRLRTIRMKTA
jgi:predicted ABC-class ATPase